jgi:hypothetical protein
MFIVAGLPGGGRTADAMVHKRSRLGDPSARATSQLLAPFLQLMTSHVTASHLSSPSIQ